MLKQKCISSHRNHFVLRFFNLSTKLIASVFSKDTFSDSGLACEHTHLILKDLKHCRFRDLNLVKNSNIVTLSDKEMVPGYSND